MQQLFSFILCEMQPAREGESTAGRKRPLRASTNSTGRTRDSSRRLKGLTVAGLQKEERETFGPVVPMNMLNLHVCKHDYYRQHAVYTTTSLRLKFCSYKYDLQILMCVPVKYSVEIHLAERDMQIHQWRDQTPQRGDS